MDTERPERPVRDVTSPLAVRLLGQGPTTPDRPTAKAVAQRILKGARSNAVEVASFGSSI